MNKSLLKEIVLEQDKDRQGIDTGTRETIAQTAARLPEEDLLHR